MRLLALVVLASLFAASDSAPAGSALPRILFVSRRPADVAGAIPGFGPTGRALAPGGCLLVREPDGRVHLFLEPGRFFDAAHPSVSYDGRTVAFAAVTTPGTPWRIWTAAADGSDLAPVTRDDRALDLAPLGAAAPRHERYDDLDPCWLPDGRIVFASTREPQEDETTGGPVTNLFVVGADGAGLLRVTSDRNGAEAPSVDPATGRILYSRWWHNRWRPSATDPHGLTTDPARALPGEVVSLWQAVSVAPDGEGTRLAGGHADDRALEMLYQPRWLADGTLIGVSATRPSLVPAPGETGLLAFAHGFGAVRCLTPRGWNACAPAVLPDGRIVASLDPGGRGDFGLYLVSPRGGRPAKLLDLPGTLELDAVALAPRRSPPVAPAAHRGAPPDLPPLDAAAYRDESRTFRFDCMNVFANAAVNAPIPDAPRVQPGLTLRMFGVVARPGIAGGDSAILLREVPVSPYGAVHVDDVPADVPLFEQLVDARGQIVMTGNGPAHGTGFNANRLETGTKCVGCHAGHSAQPVPGNGWSATWTNVAPSATASASSVAPGNAGARAVTDRRTAGAPDAIGWIASARDGQWVRLDWPLPVELRGVTLYGFAADPSRGTDVALAECEVRLLLDGRVTRTLTVHDVAARGTGVAFDPLTVNALEVRPRRITGRITGRPVVGLAEIEALGRLAAGAKSLAAGAP